MQKNRGGKTPNNRSLVVGEFVPTSWEETRVLEIAQKVHETEVRFLLSVADRFGIHLIERAYGELADMLLEGKPVQSRARLLNHLIQKHHKKR